MVVHGRRQQTLLDYEGFVGKFKPKKTTDDCITPDAVYGAVRDWAVAEYGLEGREVVRPFWPGGDYEMFDYPEGCVVIDNPPFSILAKIVRDYNEWGLDYFLFAPTLTNFGIRDTNHIIAECRITYENGALVNTSFVTNLGDWLIHTQPQLAGAVADAQEKTEKRSVAAYRWPDEMCTAAGVAYPARRGVEFRVAAHEAVWVPNLDGARAMGRAVFGSGFLLSSSAAARLAAARLAAERLAAERLAAERLAADEGRTRIALSERERLLVAGLDRKGGGR